MIKSSDIESLITDGLMELDGVLDSKQSENGKQDLYFVNVQRVKGRLVAIFNTWLDGNPNNIETDKYKITIEYLNTKREEE